MTKEDQMDFLLFHEYAVCFFLVLVGNLLAGNVLGGVHAAGHVLGAKKAPMPRLLQSYWHQHLAHHIVEMQHDDLEPETRQAFMVTPFAGRVFIIFTTVVSSCMLAVPIAVIWPSDGLYAFASLWTGMMSFFVLYEEVHARTHAGKKWFISARHAKHHGQPARFFGIYWCHDWVASHRWLFRMFCGGLSLLHYAENQLMRFGWFARAMEQMLTEAEERLNRAKKVSRLYNGQAE